MSSYGPCSPYATADDLVCDGTCGDLDLTDEAEGGDLEKFNQALRWASDRIYAVTNGRWGGVCSAVIRPDVLVCRRADFARERDALLTSRHPYPAYPVLVDADVTATFVNVWVCGCDDHPCGCSTRRAVRLPWLPVQSVTEVLIDGVVFTDWRLIVGTNELERTDGLPWPAQDRLVADGQPGSWSVEFMHGVPMPAEGVPLTAAFACELWKRACGGACSLPDGVRVLSRPGIEYMLIDWAYRDQNLTGFAPLDDWLIGQLGGLGQSRTRPRMWTGKRRPRSLLGGT